MGPIILIVEYFFLQRFDETLARKIEAASVSF